MILIELITMFISKAPTFQLALFLHLPLCLI